MTWIAARELHLADLIALARAIGKRARREATLTRRLILLEA